MKLNTLKVTQKLTLDCIFSNYILLKLNKNNNQTLSSIVIVFQICKYKILKESNT